MPLHLHTLKYVEPLDTVHKLPVDASAGITGQPDGRTLQMLVLFIQYEVLESITNKLSLELAELLGNPLIATQSKQQFFMCANSSTSSMYIVSPKSDTPSGEFCDISEDEEKGCSFCEASLISF